MSHQATEPQVNAVVGRVKEIGLKIELSRGEDRTLVGVIGSNAYAYREAFSHLPGIKEIIPITKPFKLASREFRSADTVVDVGGVKVGGTQDVVVMAGPCSVEGEEMLIETARHVAARGARMLCERGIRTFEVATRFTLDLNVIPLARELTHLPMVVDPSQATGKWSLVRPMALAAVAAGAHGLLVEVHPHPDEALSDGAQSLDFAAFDRMMDDLHRMTSVLTQVAAK